MSKFFLYFFFMLNLSSFFLSAMAPQLKSEQSKKSDLPDLKAYFKGYFESAAQFEFLPPPSRWLKGLFEQLYNEDVNVKKIRPIEYTKVTKFLHDNFSAAFDEEFNKEYKATHDIGKAWQAVSRCVDLKLSFYGQLKKK